MDKFKIPADIEEEAKKYIADVCDMLESNGVMELWRAQIQQRLLCWLVITLCL